MLNWPVTGGWRIETGRGGRAEVRIGSTALRLDEDTTVDFARLDDHSVQVALLRGGLSLRLRSREILGEFELLTQRERLVFEDIGRYRVDVDRPAGLTAVTSFFGRVRIGTNRSTFVVGSGQRGELAAAPMTSFEITAAAADRFDEWVATRDAREESVRSSAYVSRETTGIELLDEHGDWRPVEQYGAVWFPRGVPVGWAPYRYGRWAWISPWGWTWIDDAPWGFAPLHYGRWVVVGGIWGWYPGYVVPRPVYAPALVGWYGPPVVGVAAGAPVGWFPLGPREAYVPGFRHSPRYLRVVNVQQLPNVADVTVVRTPRYAHHHPDRSTWVADDRFGRPEPVQRGQRPPPSEWRQYIARPQPPVNVPGTKRRQDADARPAPAMAPEAAPPTGSAPLDARPIARPPSPIPPAASPAATPPPRPDILQPGPPQAPPLPAPAGRPPVVAQPRAVPPAALPAMPPQPGSPSYAPPRDAPPRDAGPPPFSPRPADAPAPRGGSSVQRDGPRPPRVSPPGAPGPVPAHGAVAAPPVPPTQAPLPLAQPAAGETGRAAPARPLPPARANGDDSGGDRPGRGREATR
ncbi:MAG: hypothetical protein MUF32_03655 [Burkholderiaceae bacterium]|nr:hypothetical protein [Burkholderiaceae bacterium]